MNDKIKKSAAVYVVMGVLFAAIAVGIGLILGKKELSPAEFSSLLTVVILGVCAFIIAAYVAVRRLLKNKSKKLKKEGASYLDELAKLTSDLAQKRELDTTLKSVEVVKTGGQVQKTQVTQPPADKADDPALTLGKAVIAMAAIMAEQKPSEKAAPPPQAIEIAPPVNENTDGKDGE